MNNITDNIDQLLEKPCYVIDFLPERVPEESDGQYFDVDYYLLNSSKYVMLKVRFVNVILKLMCYYHIKILWDEWIDKPDPELVENIVSEIMNNHSGTLDCFFPDENMLLVFEWDTLYLAVYNAPQRTHELMKQIAASEGLFWRAASDDTKYDCGFEKENNWFRYRTGAIIIHNDKMLFVKSAIGDYYYMVGGGVHMGETSQACIEREVYEETGIRACAEHLAVVCENFFKGKGGKIDGLDCHTIEFYYSMKIQDKDLSMCKSKTDSGEELIWLSFDEVESSKIKPDFLKENIKSIIRAKETIHIIEERDR